MSTPPFSLRPGPDPDLVHGHGHGPAQRHIGGVQHAQVQHLRGQARAGGLRHGAVVEVAGLRAEGARARDLHGVLAAAEAAYRARLHRPEGRAALDYLHRRGLSDETINRFGLGWSGEGRGALAAELKAEGIEPAQLVEAGLMKAREEGGGGFSDFFFNRVMFPIRDRRGRTISFGGRTLGDGWSHRGVRTERYLYGTDGVDTFLYDRLLDPDEMVNLVDDPAYAGVRSTLELRRRELIDCAGWTCNQQFGPVPEPVTTAAREPSS